MMPDMLGEAVRSALDLGNFRRFVRVEIPFPLIDPNESIPDYNAALKYMQVRAALDEVCRQFAARLAACVPGGRAKVELANVRAMKPSVVLVACPMSQDVAYIQALAAAAPKTSPIIVFNALWEREDFFLNEGGFGSALHRDAPSSVEWAFAREFERDEAVAYSVEEYTVPMSWLDKLTGGGVRMAVKKS
eukprot:jgi/Mesvir1/394/Mv11285-RA.1